MTDSHGMQTLSPHPSHTTHLSVARKKGERAGRRRRPPHGALVGVEYTLLQGMQQLQEEPCGLQASRVHQACMGRGQKGEEH